LSKDERVAFRQLAAGKPAVRIRARAIRRCGELLRAIEPPVGG